MLKRAKKGKNIFVIKNTKRGGGGG